MGNWERALVRTGANLSLFSNGFMSSFGSALGFEAEGSKQSVAQAQEVLRNLQYDNSTWDNGNLAAYVAGSWLPKVIDGISSALVEIPLEAIDVASRLTAFIKWYNASIIDTL